MSAGAPIVELRDVRKYFPLSGGILRPRRQIKAVDGVTIRVHAGETFGLVGESGSGKTTTANIILGLEEPTSGSVLANNQVITGDTKRLHEFRTWTQPVFQNPVNSLDPRMRIGAIIAEPLVINKPALGSDEVRARVEALLGEVGLSPEHASRFPHEFSGGQRQRIAVARALSLEPRLMVLDEPVSALDVSIAAQIINLLKELQANRGISFFWISHNLATVSYMADRVGAMYCGLLIETGSASNVLRTPLHPYTKVLVRAAMPQRLDIRDESLVARGEPASPINLPPGCRYHPRCPFVMPVCSEVQPPLREVEAGREVACHLYG